MTIDLAAAVRKLKPAKRRSRLATRPRETLLEWTRLAGQFPPALLLDTSVYIHRAAGRLPQGLREVIDNAMLFHCSVALAELATGVANADPKRPGWKMMFDHYADLFATIPQTRLVTPDSQTWVEAGVVAGTLARIQGFAPYQHKECLNDALIFLTATKIGLPVLTANRDEFDMIQQLAPAGRFVHYGSP